MVLRRVLPEDAPDVREISFYDGVPAADDDQARAMLARIDGDMAAGVGLHWGIAPVGASRLAGTVGFYRGYPDNVGEVGYALCAAYRGRGLMTEAVRLAVAFGFERLRLAAVVAYTAPDNLASQAVLARVGFVAVPHPGPERAYRLEPPGRMPTPAPRAAPLG